MDVDRKVRKIFEIIPQEEDKIGKSTKKCEKQIEVILDKREISVKKSKGYETRYMRMENMD